MTGHAVAHPFAGPDERARRRGRPSPAETAEITRLILTSALEVFSQQSFDDASIEGIAARAGVKKDTIYKRFPDKRALLRGALQERVSTWAKAGSMTVAGETLEERLKSYAVLLLRHATSPEGRLWIRLVESAWQGLEELNERRAAVGYDQAQRIIANEIRRWTAHEKRPARDPEMVATALMAMLTGWTDATGLDAAVAEEEVTRFAHAAVDLVIRGRAAW